MWWCGDSLRFVCVRALATLPVGAPLAGYNYPPRRVELWPIPKFGEYTTWMEPSVGVLDPNFAKALVLDDGTTQLCLVAIDFIGADEDLADLAYNYAVEQGAYPRSIVSRSPVADRLGYGVGWRIGFPIPRDNVIVSAAHTHSSGVRLAL